MSNETTVYVKTVYWEGDETYRPFVTVKTPKQWPTKRMAFYKSTGSSNADGKNEYRKGTWFPTLGLLQPDSTLFDDLKQGDVKNDYTPYCILKRSVFSEIFKIYIANWDVIVLRQTELNEKHKIYGIITHYLKTKISPSKKLEEEIEKVKKFCGLLVYYCQYWWQVQMSAQLGEGYWKNVPEFKEFVLSYDYNDYIGKNHNIFTERPIPLTSIMVKFNIDENTKDDAIRVMDVLNNEDAIIKKLLYRDYKEHKQSLLDIFMKGVSLSKQRKSKSKSLSETKEPPTKKIKRSSSETKEKEPPTKKIKRSPAKTRYTRRSSHKL
jgi:hypothetical protein